MSDNISKNSQQIVQDLIVVDVHELKVRLAGFERLLDDRSTQSDERFRSIQKENEMRATWLLAAVREAKAQIELAHVREISELRERVEVVESKLETRAS